MTTEDKKKELSKFYKLGYEVGFKTATLIAKDIKTTIHDEQKKEIIEKIILKMIEAYNKHPAIKEIELSKYEMDL